MRFISRRFVMLSLLCAYPLMSGSPTFFARAAAGIAGVGRGSAQRERPANAEWVARQVEDRDMGRDARFDMRLRLFDRHGRVRERAMTLLVMRGAGKDASLTSKSVGNRGGSIGDRLLIRFTYPNDIKGTAFLVWERPGGEDERFLYLPALGRVRRIAGAERQESFVGTDFSYEDLGGREFDDYRYALVDEHAWGMGPDGKASPAYKLEARAKDPEVTYPRTVSVVLKDIFVVVHADIYNRRNERQKTYDVRRLERVEEIWTVLDAVIVNDLERSRTELSVTSADYNVGLKEGDFSRRELERSVG